MSITFRNPPILEIIAEVHWSASPASQGSTIQPMPFILSAAFESQALEFTNKIAACGFNSVERLVPPDTPIIFFDQPVYRYRHGTASESGSEVHKAGVLVHFGPGILSINGAKNYKSWADFSDTVQQSVDDLLLTQAPSNLGESFSNIRLRYINAFNASFTDQRSMTTFLSESLGIDIRLPSSIAKLAADEANILPTLRVQIPLSAHRNLYILISEQAVNGAQAIVLDSTIIDSTPVTLVTKDVMATFHSLKDILHNLFLGLTETLVEKMQPMEV